jgi:hypothetical protein
MIIQCQSCSKKLKVPDSAAGKKAKCPRCESVIVIEPADSGASEPVDRPRKSELAKKKRASASDAAGTQPTAKRRAPKKKTKKRKRPADDMFGDDFGDLSQGEDYDEPDNPYAAPRATGGGGKKNQKRGRNSEGLKTVGAGLLVQGWAIVGTILLVAVCVVMMMAASTGAGAGGALMLMGVGSIVAGIAMLIGEVMGLAAPADSGAKGLIIATVCCSAINICVSIANSVAGSNLVMAGVGGLSGLGRVVLFLLFLRAIANFAGFHERGDRAMIILIGMPASMILMVGGIFVLPGLLSGIMAFVCSIALLVFSVMYVFLLFGLGGDLRG